MPDEIHKNGEKNGQFLAHIDLKIAESAIFHSKVLHKIYSKDVFEEYINFKIFRFLRHCGVIPVQSSGAYLPPSHPD
jgi:hypothetical protein